MSYNGGVHFEQGTGTLVVPVGASIRVEGAGDPVTINADMLPILAALADIPTADQEDSATIWFDAENGVLKVSTAG